MENYIEATGKTVDEAIEKALTELNSEKNEVEIEVLEEGNKGLLGILGGRTARVRVSLKQQEQHAAVGFIGNVLESMGIDAQLEYSESDEDITINITGKDSGIIIGRRGETLDALQYLASLVANKGTENYKRVIVDIENYREKRKDTLVKLANRLADQVSANKKSITLEPMNPFERRVIHSTLQDNARVKTYSIGEEPNRKVVISLK